MTASYEFWQDALAGKSPPMHEGDPQPGFYRKRTSRGGPYVPVAIWEQDGKMIALVDGKEADAGETWSYVCDKPVTEEAYRAKAAGQLWPDEDPATAQSLAPPPAGHNNPPQDEAEVLKGQIEAASANAADYAEINDDDVAKKAQSVRSRLLELAGDAEKKHKVEKAPHLEAGRLVDKKWFALRDAATATANAIRAAMSAHETRKEKARLKVEADRLAALQQAEKERLAAEAAGKPAPPPPPEIPVAPPSQPVAPIRGAYGRGASVRDVKVAIVVDQDLAYAGLKTHPELVTLIAALAQRAVNAGLTIPGVTVEKKKDVR